MSFISEQLPFLRSSRFWQVVVAFVFILLGQYGVLPPEIANSIAGILGVSVSIKTVDRMSEKISEVRVVEK